MIYIPFSKYSGCGNDFILIDHRKNDFVPHRDLITKLCLRCDGIGADGVILLENSIKADLKMRIFNADGSEAEMCGNGIRCLMQFAIDLGLAFSECTIETMNAILALAWDKSGIRTSLIPPEAPKKHFLSAGNRKWEIFFLNTGVPHSIIFVDELQDSYLDDAPEIRYHPAFPQGTNVNFVKKTDEKLHIRTYERGVEKETLACGTGVAAAALASYYAYQMPSPITVIPRSGEPMVVSFEVEAQKVTQLTLSGPAKFIFRGEFALKGNNDLATLGHVVAP
jgi:diaminopimelate epimerase